MTEEERIIEFLKLNGAVEVTEEEIKNDPYLQKSREDFRKSYQEHLDWKKSQKKKAAYV